MQDTPVDTEPVANTILLSPEPALYRKKKQQHPFCIHLGPGAAEETMGYQKGGGEGCRGHNQIPRSPGGEGQTRDGLLGPLLTHESVP